MASNRFYIPNVNEFFEGLLSLLQQCGDCVNENTDGGHGEFLVRRLEEYQRTLRVMYGRVTELAQDYCSRIRLDQSPQCCKRESKPSKNSLAFGI